MKHLPTRFVVGQSIAPVIECGLVMVLIGLAFIAAWVHFSASLELPHASASKIASVETTEAVRSRELHRASRTPFP